MAIGKPGSRAARNVSAFPVSVSSNSDYVHDASHNSYGSRLAMCTSAQRLLIWDRDQNDEWIPSATINYAHSGPIWRLDWAHPEFGQIIASASEDRAIAIWSERPSSSSETDGGWRKRATLTDSPQAVTDVQFAPRHFGLKLAACCSDGTIRVYHAPDPLNLAYWEVEDFLTDRSGCTALSWCGSEDRERLAIVCQSGFVKVFEKHTRWVLGCERQVIEGPLKDCAWSPNLCRDVDWLAVCGDSPSVEICSYAVGDTAQLMRVHVIDCGIWPVWRIAWNLTGTLLAVAPESGQVQLWRLVGPSASDWEKVDEDEEAFE